MRKRQVTVSVRVSLKARNRLKIMAIRTGKTFIEIVDSLILNTH